MTIFPPKWVVAWKHGGVEILLDTYTYNHFRWQGDFKDSNIVEQKDIDFAAQVVKATEASLKYFKQPMEQIYRELKKRDLLLERGQWTKYGQIMKIINKDFGQDVRMTLEHMYTVKHRG